MEKISLFIASLVMGLGLFVGVDNSYAAKGPLVGVADNGPAVFYDPNYISLNTKISRKVIPWDWNSSQWEINHLNAWLAGAKGLNVKPLISFSFSWDPARKKHLPTLAEYDQMIRVFRKNHPGVTEISPWNEANHSTQPTWNNPKRAAQFYNIARTQCKRCTLVAGDILDQPTSGLVWAKKYSRALKEKPKVWGIHNYLDALYLLPWKKTFAYKFSKAYKGEIWLTETGGIVASSHREYNMNSATASIKYLLNNTTKQKRIKRIYLYSWYGSNNVVKPFVWDSGIMDVNAQPRQAFYLISKYMKTH